jgi:methylmalonyl-CoA mutase cobalamin-binding subunit
MHDMPEQRPCRVVVGAAGGDERARLVARALLLSGCEVVFVGGGQSTQQLVRTVLAEDAGAVVVDGGEQVRLELSDALTDAGLRDVAVRACDQPDAPRGGDSG